jgi:hypothetical protein
MSLIVKFFIKWHQFLYFRHVFIEFLGQLRIHCLGLSFIQGTSNISLFSVIFISFNSALFNVAFSISISGYE